MNRARFELGHDQVVITQYQQRFNQRTGLLPGGDQQGGFRRYLVGDVHRFARQHQEARDVLRLVRLAAFQHLQAIQLAAGFATQRRDGW